MKRAEIKMKVQLKAVPMKTEDALYILYTGFNTMIIIFDSVCMHVVNC